MRKVRNIVHTQLLLATPLPEPVLRYAERLATGDVDIASRLAARFDLPADLRARMRADTRPPVRAAYCLRADLETAELLDLLGAETRGAVLAEVAGKSRDAVLDMVLWQRLVARPTKGLAVALIGSVTEFYRVAPTLRLRPQPPAAVVAALLRALGPVPNLARHPEHQLRQMADQLGAGADPATADLAVGEAEAPVDVRIAAAGADHVSSTARIALLAQVWEAGLRKGLAKNTLQGPFETRSRHMRPDVDLVERMLTEACDVGAPVLDYLRATLTERAFAAALPHGWAAGWLEMVESYTPTESQDDCAACAEAAAAAAAPWPPADLVVPGRDPERPRHGLGSPPQAAAAEPLQAEVEVSGSADEESEDLAGLNDFDLAGRVRAGLGAGDRDRVAGLARQRRSTVVAAALIECAEVAEADAVDLLVQRWFKPSPQVLVRLVGLRPGQVEFALAAVGRDPEAILTAFGPATFADPGERRPHFAGGVRLARQVAAALAEGDGCPGWEAWRERMMYGPHPVKALERFVTHPDTPDEAVLELPWPLVSQLLSDATNRWATWENGGVARLQAVVVAACAATLAQDAGTWDVYARLGETFTGSVRDLLDMAVACAD